MSAAPSRDYSRTEFVFGKDALERMQKATFFVFGCQGLGAEICKNIFLTGCSISMCDSDLVTSLDLCSNPFFTTADVGRRRDEVLVQAIKELNPVKACAQIDLVDIRQLSQYQAVVYTRSSRFTAIEVDEYCRAHSIPFVLAESYGLCGRVFSDFGNEFVVYDVDGERVEDLTVSEFMVDRVNGVFRVFLGFKDVVPYQDSQLLSVTDVHFRVFDSQDKLDDASAEALGKEFNEHQFRINVVTPRSVELLFDESHTAFVGLLEALHAKGSTTSYLRGGYVRRIKEPMMLSFNSLQQETEAPHFSPDMLDFTKMGRNEIYAVVFRFLDTHREALAGYNRPWNTEDAAKFMAELKANSTGTQLEALTNDEAERVVKLFIGQHMGQFSPVCSIIGGWGAQEALKAVSGKYMPIMQTWYFDAFELLKELPSEEDSTIRSCRYDGQGVIFGWPTQQLIQKQKLFMVGAGALGCELLKFLALSGACSENPLDLTDLDSIENSNLSRQFLFREKDAGKMKSVVAAERAKGMNPDCKIEPKTLRIGESNPMPQEFWENQTIVINALDNVDTRRFVDRKCVQFSRPLLESGTLGQKANSQVIVPRVTQIYSATQDPDSGEAPACTIHNFPNNITHCIVYATSEFKGLFEAAAEDLARWQEVRDSAGLNIFIEQLKADQSTLKGRVARLMQFVQAPILAKQDCYRFAAIQFKRFFAKMIVRLLELNPVDSKNSDGTPFWSADKRPPTPLEIDYENPNHIAFLQSCSKLAGDVFGIAFKFDLQEAKQAAQKVAFEEVYTADECGALVDQYEGNFSGLVEKYFKFKPTQQQTIRAIQFEKDDLNNGHITFLASFSNLRAQNYGIPAAEEQDIRRIAGNIIPAMITTTAAIVGHVGIEFVKLVKGFRALEDYRQVFMNFALPLCQVSENEPCTRYRIDENRTFTVWDHIDMRGDPTVQEVLDKVSAEYGVEVDGIMSGAKSVYMSFMHEDSRKAERVRKLLKEMGESHEGELILVVLPDGETELPSLRLRE